MKKRAFLILRILITTGLLYYVYSQIDRYTLLNIIKKGNVTLLIYALIVFILSNITGSFQWYILLIIHRLKIKYWYIFRLYLSSAFFNNFLPSNIGGDVVKAYKFVKNKRNSEIALSSIIWDRAVSFYILLFFTSFSSIFVLKKVYIFIIFLTVSVIGVISLKFIIKKRITGSILRNIRNEKIRTFLDNFFKTFKFYFRLNRKTLFYYVVAVITQFLKIFINYFIVLYLGLKISLIEIYFIIPVIGMISILPISINGIGLRESAGSYLFGLINKSGITTSILFSIGNIIITIGNSFGAIFLKWGTEDDIVK